MGDAIKIVQRLKMAEVTGFDFFFLFHEALHQENLETYILPAVYSIVSVTSKMNEQVPPVKSLNTKWGLSHFQPVHR